MSLQTLLEKKLQSEFLPRHLMVVNESHLHKGHAGDDGSGESHFFIEISAEALDKKPRIQAHRLIHKVLEEDLSHIHALRINVKRV